MKRTASKRDGAEAFLVEVLSSGPFRVNDLVEAAERKGHNRHTLDAAARRIGIEKNQDATGWLWKLPEPLPEPTKSNVSPRLFASLPSLPTSNFTKEEIVGWASQFDEHPAVAALLRVVDQYQEERFYQGEAVREMHSDAVAAVKEVRTEVLDEIGRSDSLGMKVIAAVFNRIENKLRSIDPDNIV